MDAFTWPSIRFLYRLYKETRIFYRYYRINQLKPILYLPLKSSFQNNADVSGHEIAVFPFLREDGNLVEPLSFRRQGLFFPGQQMLSAHLESLPVGAQPRSVALAIKPMGFPTRGRPMFFFSYGHRVHDRAFGLYWGSPVVESDEDERSNIGIRLFYYCAIDAGQRTSPRCDSKPFTKIESLGKWIILVVSYDGKRLCVYESDIKVYDEEICLDTANTQYLNVGGFLHHIEGKNLLPKDMEYSMHGYIREFLIFDREISAKERSRIFRFIRNNL